MTITDLLDGVEPDCWRYETVRGTYRYRGPCINFDKDYNSLKPVGLLTVKRVEALLEANRKQVLLMAMRAIKYEMGQNPSYEILRRMALEPTGVDKGVK